MITRCVRRSLRDPEAFFTSLLLPVILMLLFVYVFGGAMSAEATRASQYANYVVPGLSMPIRSSSVLAGHIAASVARNLVAAALVVAVGLAVGWRPSASLVRWLAAIGMIVAFILAMSWLAAMAGLLVRGPEAANSVTFIIMFLPYLSSAFVPAGSMTRVLRPIAANQPVTAVVETMRGLWMGRTSTGASVAHEALLAVAYCAAILVVSAAAAGYLFRHRSSAR